MKKIFKPLCIAILFISLWGVSSCKKNDPPVAPITTVPPKDTIKPKPVVLEDTLKGNWVVMEAKHNGSPDFSSKGLKLNFKTNGTYTLVGNGYAGTWEFLENKTKVLIDKSTPEFKTTWTLVKITNKNLEITFKSPFTGGNAEWKMIRF